MHAFTSATAVLLGAATLAAGTPTIVPKSVLHSLPRREIVQAIDAAASELENRFQPVTDFDKDGCYYTAAVGADGEKNGGWDPSNGVPPDCLASVCRDNNRLENNNVYSRSRCNNGWCAIMYEYYFEKDQVICGSWGAGHRHDWENIVVFVQDNQVKRVAPSCHGGYDGATNEPPIKDNDRAKVVYHKDGGETHCWRIATADDDAIENYTGDWYLGRLVGWSNWPSEELRTIAMEDFGGPRAKLEDGAFTDTLRAAMDDTITGFDPAVDE